MKSSSSYIQTDEKIFINELSIVWIKKMNDCLRVGTVETGSLSNPYTICKSKNELNYCKLNDKLYDR